VYIEVTSASTPDETAVPETDTGATVPVTTVETEEEVTVVEATVEVVVSVVWAATVAARRERTVV
jgi:hypothetical protein